MKVSRAGIVFLVLLFFLISQGACKSKTEPNVEPEHILPEEIKASHNVIITFAVPANVHAIFEGLAQEFEIDHPAISVRLIDLDKLLKLDSSHIPQDEALLEIAQSADSMIWRWSPFFRGQPLLLNLAPLIEGDVMFDAQDFYRDGSLACDIEELFADGWLSYFSSAFRNSPKCGRTLVFLGQNATYGSKSAIGKSINTLNVPQIIPVVITERGTIPKFGRRNSMRVTIPSSSGR